MLEIKKKLAKNFKKSYVGKAGTIAKKEFGIFQTMLFRENSEKLEPQIRKNWSRPLPLTPRFFPCMQLGIRQLCAQGSIRCTQCTASSIITRLTFTWSN